MMSACGSQRFVELIFGRTMAPPPPVAIDLPEQEDEENDLDSGEELGFGAAEGQSFMIEYVDARGNASRRRITVWSVIPGAGGVPCLVARCHEREAQRNFRVDRIRCCIDYEGQVHDDVQTFLSESLGLGVALADYQRLGARTDVDERWRQIIALCRPYALLMAGLSESDGVRRPEERAVALGFCRRLSASRELELHAIEEAALERYYKNLHPTPEMIFQAVDRLIGEPADDKVALLVAGRKLIEADGILDPNEREMFDQLTEELVGLPIE